VHGTLVTGGDVAQTAPVPIPRHACLVVAALSACAASAAAVDAGGIAPRLDLSAGALGALDGGTPLAMGVEYHGRAFGRWSLVPGAGLVAGDDDSRFAYANLSRGFALGRDWTATIRFGAGHFHDGTAVQLGHPLVFQSGIEFGRWVEGRWRVGLAFDHLSNAGLAQHNPGTEMLVLRVSMPLGGGWAQPSAGTTGAGAGAAPAAASRRSSSRRISSPASAR
jgi:hypothetical protein